MNNLLSDIKTTAKVFGRIRKARKGGADAVEIKTQRVKVLPCINANAAPGFYDTVEGCTLSNCGKEIDDAAGVAYRQLPYETKRKFARTPKNGEFIERLQIWRDLLEPVLPPKQHRKAMIAIIHWYIHIKRNLMVIRTLKAIDYPLYPDILEDAVLDKHDNMHKALIDKVNDDLYVIWDYKRKAGSKVAHNFIYSDKRDRLVRLVMWFNISDDNFSVTYAEYRRVREDLDLCLNSLLVGREDKDHAVSIN